MTLLLIPVEDAVRRPSSEIFREDEWGSVSFYSKAASCGEYAVRSRLESSPREEPEHNGKPDARTTGKLFHSIVEHYHQAVPFKDVAFDYSDHAYNASVAEALRLFRAYRERTPHWAFGTPIGAELEIPRSADERLQVEKIVGIAPFKLVLDLMSHFDERTVAWWADEERNKGVETRYLELPGPGIYITDHKTMGRRRTYMHWRWTKSLQFQTYMHVARGLGYDVKGVIANCIIGNKEVELDAFYGDWADAMALEAVQQALQRAKLWADTRHKNPFNCIGEYVCPYLLDCDKVNK